MKARAFAALVGSMLVASNATAEPKTNDRELWLEPLAVFGHEVWFHDDLLPVEHACVDRVLNEALFTCPVSAKATVEATLHVRAVQPSKHWVRLFETRGKVVGRPMPIDALSGLAPRDAVPRFKSSTPLAQLGLGPEEGFVLSRVDGNTRLGELLDLVPFEHSRTVEIIRKLWLSGAIEIPGHAPPVIAAAMPKSDSVPIRVAPATSSQPHALTTTVPQGVDLTLEQVRHIDEVFSTLRDRNAFELLALERGVDKRDVKRAYFKMSKEFHPDRFYGKNLGIYAERLTQIFRAMKSAFDLLSDDDRRAAYEESVFGSS